MNNTLFIKGTTLQISYAPQGVS